jgi:cytochrome c-type biogenesis protein CcmH/NrfF
MLSSVGEFVQRLARRNVVAPGAERIPRGLKPRPSMAVERPKAEALRYPEANGSIRPMRRLVQGAIVCLLAVVMLGAADPDARFNRLGHQMICMCGCGQIMLECNHVGCPVSPVMINELHAQVDGGGTDTLIMNWFAAKYGAIVLASPIRGGFDRVAWITPLAVFFLATVGTGFLIRVWKLRSVQSHAGQGAIHDAGLDAMRDRIRRETEY